MIGPEFLSTFRLQPIKTIRDWENARLWMVYLEAELYRRNREAEHDELLQRNVDPVQDLAAVGSAVSHVGLADSHVGLADSHLGSADSHVSSADSHVGSADSHVGLADSHLGLADTHTSSVLSSAEDVLALTANPFVASASADSDFTPTDFNIAAEISPGEPLKFPDRLTIEFSLDEVLAILGVLTKDFDRYYWFSESGDVIKEIRYRMKIREFRNRDLVEEIGSKGYVSDILHRRKPLTLRTARVFREFFDIPAEWLMSDYPT